MADGWDAQPSGGRTPSPTGNRNRSRSPDRRMQTDDRDDRGRTNGGGGGGQNPGNNLHVSGLSNRVEERDLEDAFAKFGRVSRCQVMRDPHTKDPRGFAFVTMETAEEADAAKAGLAGTEILGKVISIEKARRGRARTPTPGAYHGPPKREEYGGRGGGRDYRDSRRYDDRRDYRDDRYDRRDYDRRDYDRRDDYYGRRDDYRRDDYGSRRDYAQPMRDDRGYDDRRRE